MMELPPEPDDIDFVVAGHDSDPESIGATIEFVKALKSRPEHAEQVREALRTLESLGIDTSEFGIADDPGGYLAQWQKTREALEQRKVPESVVVGKSGESR
jgi:hypothetical protein